LLRRVGRLEQVAGVRLVTLGDGQGRGVRVLEFRTGTNRDAGRADARERGELQWLEPGETRQYDLEIGALQGTAALDEFGTRVSGLLPVDDTADRR
jgi:hypothetical protein